MVEILTTREIHYEQWARLMYCYFDFYQYEVNESHLQGIFEKIKVGKIQSLLAFEGTNAIGIANYMFNQSTFCNLECYLSDLYVDAEYRGQRIAKIMMDKIFQHAKEIGCGNINWITAADNEPAQKLYNKMGARPNFIMYQHDL